MARSYGNDDENPFASPGFEPDDRRSSRRIGAVEKVRGKVKAPAIALIVASSLGLLMSIVSLLIAAFSPPVQVDPELPKILQDFQRWKVGPVAIMIQSAFIVGNSVVIFGAVQMMHFRSRVLAILVSILSIINVGNCCCVLGAPFGFWSLLVLLSRDVTKAFDAAQRPSR